MKDPAGIYERTSSILSKQLADAKCLKLQPPESLFEQYPDVLEQFEDCVDIIFHDFLLREEFYGIPQNRSSYCQRFPQFQASLEKQFLLYSVAQLANAKSDQMGLVPGWNKLSELLYSDCSPANQEVVYSPSWRPETLADRYIIGEVIGEGSFGVVFRGQDSQLKRDVAIKIAKWELNESDRRYRRAEREAEAAARLVHPFVVGVFEFGDSHGRPFLIQEYMQGGSLARRLSTGPIEYRKSAEWMQAICDAAEYAHQLGVVHRDIKPGNILFDSQNQAKLGDFGLASFAETASTITQQGDLLGTPAYMSPEQSSGNRDITPASDIYSLGVVLYELLTGAPPFQGSVTSVIHQTQSSKPASLRESIQSVPQDLEMICLKAMEKLPRDRYNSAREMSDDLKRFLEGQPVLARPLSAIEIVIRRMQQYPVVSAMVLGMLLVLGFFLGGAFQYFSVVEQRNRAQSAEKANQRLLASEAESAGDLAWQRGQWTRASSKYQDALDRDIEERIQVTLKLARCEIAKGQYEKAGTLFNSIADEPLEETYQLLKAQCSLGSGQISETLCETLDSIDAKKLPIAEREFLLGLKARHSLVSLSHFQNTLQFDPYHPAARRLSLLTALALGDFEDVLDRVDVAIEMFPNDANYYLLKSLGLAGSGQLESALSVLGTLPEKIPDVQEWIELTKFLFAVCHSDRYIRKLTPPTYQDLGLLVKKFEVEFLPILRKRHWYLPPRIEIQLDRFFQWISADTIAEDQLDELQSCERDILQNYPEATFLTIIGRERLNRLPRGLDQLRAVKDIFASAANSTSLREEAKTQALWSLFGTTANLALVQNDDVETNQNIALEVLRQLNPDSLIRDQDLSVAARFAIRMSAWDEADRYTSQFVSRAEQSGSRQLLFDAIWNRAVYHEARRQWLQVLSNCDRAYGLLTIDSSLGDVQVLQSLRSRACHELVLSMEAIDLHFPWPTLFESALLDEQWSLAEQIIARMDSEPDQEFNDLTIHYRSVLDLYREGKWQDLKQKLIEIQSKEIVLAGQQLSRILEKCEQGS